MRWRGPRGTANTDRPDDRSLPILRAIRFLVLKATNPPSGDIVALFTDLAMETAPALSLSDDFLGQSNLVSAGRRAIDPPK
jgi:hypothetical protein